MNMPLAQFRLTKNDLRNDKVNGSIDGVQCNQCNHTEMSMKTMTIRNVPDEVAKYLSSRAASEGTSVNAMTVSLLQKAAGLEPRQRRRRDLSWLAGSWSAEVARHFDETVADCRKVDSDAWK